MKQMAKSTRQARRWFAGGVIVTTALTLFSGCETDLRTDSATPDPIGRRRAEHIAVTRLSQDDGATTRPSGTPTDPIALSDGTPPAPLADVRLQIPDPLNAKEVTREVLDRELAESTFTDGDRERFRKEGEERIDEILKRVAQIKRDKQINMSLNEAIRKALEHSYLIQVQTYNPAIAATQIVEAEAQFDAIYYARFNYNKQDRPSSSQLTGTKSDTRLIDTGVRKLLSTGTTVSAGYNFTRSESNLVFATLNPAYFNQFTVEFRQPFLRGFGLDFNRAQIELSRLDRHASLERLRRDVRETIFNVEQAYWSLWQARRRVTVTARLIADIQRILRFFEGRLEAGMDVYKVQVNLTRSRLDQREFAFVQQRSEVKNAEDALKSLINDPALNLSQDIEIIPTDVPTMEPLVIDQLGEVTAGLTYRAELNEAKVAIEQAQIGIGVAKNRALPRLDLLFRYIVDGLGPNADKAFSQLGEHDFHEYVVSVDFEWPIGNRGPEAALRRARLQQAQAIASHKVTIENVVTEVKRAIRDLQTSFDQIGPSYRAAKASEDQLRAIQQRQETRSPPNLEVELNAHEALAQARDALVQVLANYNVGLVNLERRKGTLLKYNNIIIQGADEEDAMDRVTPRVVGSE